MEKKTRLASIAALAAIVQLSAAGAMAQQLSLEVLDLKGQLIYTQFVGSNGSASRQWTIDVSHLAQGIYLLRANSEHGQQTIRFTK